LPLSHQDTTTPTVLPSFPTRRSSDLLAICLSGSTSDSSRYSRVCLAPMPASSGPTSPPTPLILWQRKHDTSDFSKKICLPLTALDRKSTRLNSSHLVISYAVFCLKKK